MKKSSFIAPSQALQTKITDWTKGFEQLHQRIEKHLGRAENRQRGRQYLQGLLSSVERKNGWQLAEYAGHANPYGIQHFLGRARWNADAVRDELQQYVQDHLAHSQGIAVINETGFLKKGKQSAGVKRQYSGTAGRIENCQVGVFLGYATPLGATLIDRRLYLPKEWTNDPARCQRAGIPSDVSFATKPQLAQQMLEHVYQTALPIQWVTADSVYGANGRFCAWLEEKQQSYAMAVPSNTMVCIGWKQHRARQLAEQTSEDDWQSLSCGDGAKGFRKYQWVRYRFNCPDDPQRSRWLVIRRSLSNENNLTYFTTYAPAETSLLQLVQVIGARWAIERCFQESKGEVGLDQYEVRSWTGWHRHITMSLCAHAFLTMVRMKELRAEKRGIQNGKNNLFDDFKRSRGL
jgi:SRSO17 transposase